MNKKGLHTCQICNALYVCLKYFQEHRRKHDPNIFPCTHCPTIHTSEHESRLHSVSHKNEPPHSCEVCRKVLGISEEEVLGTRRSIGTATDFHVFNLSVDKPIINNSNNDLIDDNNNDDDDVDDNEEEEDEDDEDNHDSDDDNDEENDEDDEENDQDDEENDDDDDDDDDEDAENETVEVRKQQETPNSSNFIYVNNTRPHRPSRPSRSTGKGKGNRKARLTTDGDVRRKFSCCHCGKSFKTKSHLQRHILTHTGEKPYHCNRCDCRFNQSSSLRNHVIAIHTKEYPHTCNNCNKGFLMPAVLQKHLQTSECGKITNQVVEGL